MEKKVKSIRYEMTHTIANNAYIAQIYIFPSCRVFFRIRAFFSFSLLFRFSSLFSAFVFCVCLLYFIHVFYFMYDNDDTIVKVK